MRLSVTARLLDYMHRNPVQRRLVTRPEIGCGAVPDTMPLGKVASRMNPLDSPSP
jgi:hypothetical protein